MALEGPLRHSTGNFMATSFTFQEMSVIYPLQNTGLLSLIYIDAPPSGLCFRRSPSLTSTGFLRSASNPVDSQTLRPNSYVRSHSAHLMSPSSDIVGPSPVTSNGTETTEIEDEALSETGSQAVPVDESPRQVRRSGDVMYRMNRG